MKSINCKFQNGYSARFQPRGQMKVLGGGGAKTKPPDAPVTDARILKGEGGI